MGDGGLDGDIACPGTSTILRIGGLEPGGRYEVWQAGSAAYPRCVEHPRDLGGVRLGEGIATARGLLTFPFEVADLPIVRPEAARTLWLVPAGGGASVLAVTWSCMARTRLSGRLVGDDGRPYLEPLKIHALFLRPSINGTVVLEDRTTVAIGGAYALEDVPLPADVELRAYDGDWLVGMLDERRADFIAQWRGRPEEDGEPWQRPFGSPATLDFEESPPNTRGETTAIARWDQPFPYPSNGPSIPDPREATCPWRRPLVSVWRQGQIDDDLACGDGDVVRMRVRRLPPESRFTIWQSESTSGQKVSCFGPSSEFHAVQIGGGRSDAHGILAETLRLRSLQQDHGAMGTMLWLVWPDGRTMDAVAQWDCLRPARLSGRLWGQDGLPFLGQARVDVFVRSLDRVRKLSTEARDGTYQLDDVPSPANLEMVVTAMGRRVAQRRVWHAEIDTQWGTTWHQNRFIPARAPAITLDFGGPGYAPDPAARLHPLRTGP